MKNPYSFLNKKLHLVLIGILFCNIITNMVFAKTINHDLPIAIEGKQLSINSFSFNAKKKSNFLFGEQKEQVERGLTVIHFKSENKLEFKTFDTYGDEQASLKMMEVLLRLQKNKATYAILAHDSATKGSLEQAEKLASIGYEKLSSLKGRQAYIMHNIGGVFYEEIHDVSLSKTINIPADLVDKEIYFPRIKYEFTPNNNRYIAHAGGEVNGVKSTNSLQALNQNYKKGFRLFELDIIETSDGKLVAAHDWKMWARFTDYTGSLPPTHKEFMKHKIYGDYTTLDMKGINNWYANHPDASLITDKVNDPITFANNFVDKNRLIMELFSVMAVEKASNAGINAMISQGPLMKLRGDKLNFLTVNNVKYVALSRRIIANQTKLMLALKEKGIKVYVYNVGFDPGKDEKYVQENELGLVYGMYADKWVFD